MTLLVDFLVDPEDEPGMQTLLRWVDREARAANSDKIRVFCLHDGFRRILRRSGYFKVKSAAEFTAKINAVEVPPGFYQRTEGLNAGLFIGADHRLTLLRQRGGLPIPRVNVLNFRVRRRVGFRRQPIPAQVRLEIPFVSKRAAGRGEIVATIPHWINSSASSVRPTSTSS